MRASIPASSVSVPPSPHRTLERKRKERKMGAAENNKVEWTCSETEVFKRASVVVSEGKCTLYDWRNVGIQRKLFKVIVPGNYRTIDRERRRPNGFRSPGIFFRGAKGYSHEIVEHMGRGEHLKVEFGPSPMLREKKGRVHSLLVSREDFTT